jgi:hypothetical protein
MKEGTGDGRKEGMMMREGRIDKGGTNVNMKDKRWNTNLKMKEGRKKEVKQFEKTWKSARYRQKTCPHSPMRCGSWNDRWLHG